MKKILLLAISVNAFALDLPSNFNPEKIDRGIPNEDIAAYFLSVPEDAPYLDRCKKLESLDIEVGTEKLISCLLLDAQIYDENNGTNFHADIVEAIWPSYH